MDQSPAETSPDVTDAVKIIRRTEQRRPRIGLILGSGLGTLADSAEDAVAFDTSDLPGYPASTVEGHRGRIVFGSLEDVEIVVLQGRVHYYEGHDPRALSFPIRLLHALGVQKLVVTNAAGGINPRYTPGTLMFITDHINLAFANPLVGPNVDGGPRFPDMSAPYDPDWTDRAEQAALEAGIPTRRGTYIWAMGPSYETPAEIRAFARLGADAVGMSTVPEVIQAAYYGIKVLGISTITNPAAGLSAAPLMHEDVLEVGRQVRSRLETLVRMVLRLEASA